jgi:secreted trypsin-like serine protease
MSSETDSQLSATVSKATLSNKPPATTIADTKLQSSRQLIVGGAVVNHASTYAKAFAWTGIGSAGWGCGGSLIHSDIVLTAAHCRWVYQGVWIGASRIDGHGGKFTGTEQLIVHPDYIDPEEVHNDIMLVKLNQTITDISQYFEYNTDANVPQNSESVHVIGFGTTSEGGNVSQVLLETDVTYVDNDSCQTTWSQLVPSLHLCTGTVEGGKDACDSDSGSPLFVQDSKGNIIQVGIVGDGIGCARAGVPSLNTRVSTYTSWIYDTICQVSSDPPASCARLKEQQELHQLGKWWTATGGRSIGLDLAVVALVFLTLSLICWNMKGHLRRKDYQEVQSHSAAPFKVDG